MTLATTAALPRCVSRNVPAFTGSVNIAGCAKPGANDRAASKADAKEIGDGGGAAAAWPLRHPGYGPSHRGQDARAPDHARDDATGAGRGGRDHLPAGPQVREGPQPHRRRAAARAGAGARVEPGYFFEGLGEPARPTAQQRLLLELARSFAALPRRQQEALADMARALAGAGARPRA